VRLLIDSHAFLWWTEGFPALGSGAHGAIGDPVNEVLISVAALWELAIKVSSGKLSLATDLETIVADQGFADHIPALEVPRTSPPISSRSV
jgi:PIN domain nuclease of toxin-antitoxin system